MENKKKQIDRLNAVRSKLKQKESCYNKLDFGMDKPTKKQKLKDFKQQYKEEAERIDALVNKDVVSEGTRLMTATEQYLLREISRLEKELYD